LWTRAAQDMGAAEAVGVEEWDTATDGRVEVTEAMVVVEVVGWSTVGIGKEVGLKKA